MNENTDERLDCPEDPSLYIIWYRARAKAFGHDFAVSRIEKEERTEYRKEMRYAISGIGVLVAGLSISDVGISDSLGKLLSDLFHLEFEKYVGETLSFLSKFFIAASALISVYSLYLSVMSKRSTLISSQDRHRTMNSLCLSIAQKTRQPESGLFDEEYKKHLVHFLNDQLRDILTIGESPADCDYARAHNMMAKIMREKTTGVAQTFTPNVQGKHPDIPPNDPSPAQAGNENSECHKKNQNKSILGLAISRFRKIFERH
ncbi:MAG: hypothetical protein PW843_18745 [Azospirillaceae bacterium]|nr:hypothetical protein [Azospirillaceae bacterium]